MHILSDKFLQATKYIKYIANRQAEIRRNEKFTNQKYLFIIPLQTDYLNLDRSSVSG